MDQLEKLKALLLSEDRAELEKSKRAIDERLSDARLRTEQVASILPAALVLSADSDPALARALAVPVSDGLKRSIEKEPKCYGDILYPVLAPAIRQAISQAMSSLLATVQRTLESTTTASGISLRIKSLTSGVPYAE